MFQPNAFQLDAFQNESADLSAFQCDAFQLDAFQNCEDLPEDLPARRRRRVTVVLRGERTRVTTPLEEWERDRQRRRSSFVAPPPVAAYTNMAQALREDEELLLLS